MIIGFTAASRSTWLRSKRTCWRFSLRPALSCFATSPADQYLVSAGLRTTQFSIPSKLRPLEPMTIQRIGRRARDGPHHAQAEHPAARTRGLIGIVPGRIDRRSKELKLTDTGLQRPLAAGKGWSGAQKRFASIFGGERTVKLRSLLREVSATGPPTVPAANA